MSERLVGLETEYALAVLDPKRKRIEQGVSLQWLMNAARDSLTHLPGIHSSGMFLENGARFYVDCGGHPEMTTPECPNPWDAVRYLRAGDRIMLGLLRQIGQTQDIGEACVFRNNVDYSGQGTTWGSHESYLHRADPRLFRQQMIPHLVSRLIYTGSGGFNSLSRGVKFTLSPRVPHLFSEESHESTYARGILHTKDETLSSAGYHRLHLLCSESTFSERALFLRVGVTALIVALIEAGVRPGEAVWPAHPLRAMRIFSEDPTCRAKVTVKKGGPMSAIAIQRHYLGLVEKHLHHASMPSWAGDVCACWAETLDLLEEGSPDAVLNRLDWAVKHKVFGDFIASQGFDWETIGEWNAIMGNEEKPPGTAMEARLAAMRAEMGGTERSERLLRRLRVPGEERGRGGDEGKRKSRPPELSPALRAKGFGEEDIPRFERLRQQLFELDTRFGEIGENGIYARLEQEGVLDFRIKGVDNIEHAMVNPPAVGRARLRGQCVRKLGGRQRRHRNECTVDWTSVRDGRKRRLLDLSDPFATEENWRDLPRGDEEIEF